MSRSLRRGGTYKKSEESRRQVLDAAVKVFAKKGLTGASVQDIANAAGLSKGAVHYHFESKDDLVERVLDRCCELLEARIVSVFSEPGTPLERLRRGLAELWVVRRDGAAEIRVITACHLAARQNPAIRKALAAELRRTRQRIIDVGLAEVTAMGLRPKVPLEVIPRLVMATLDGLAVHHEIEPISDAEEAEILKAIEQSMMSLFAL